jgi:hypothetical protein
MTLAEAVKRFNAEHGNTPIGRHQPPLTEEEVIAGIRMWGEPLGADDSEEKQELAVFQRIANTRWLPSDYKLDVITTFSWGSQRVYGWRVSIQPPTPKEGVGMTYQIRELWLNSNTQNREFEEPVPAALTNDSAAQPNAVAVRVVPQRITSPYAAGTERVYRGKFQEEWQSLFAAETDPAAKLVAALALVSLAAQSPPDENIEQILDVGEEVVRSSYGDRALEFAFDYGVPPQRMSFAGSDDWKNTYIQFDNELTSRLAGIVPEVLAPHLAQAMAIGSDARAAFAYRLMGRNASSRIHTNEAAALAIVEGAHSKVDDVDRSALCLMARLSAAFGVPGKAPELWPEIIALSRQLQQPDNASRPLSPRLRESLFRMAAQVGPVVPNTPQPPRKPGEPEPPVGREASHAMAELVLDSIIRDKQTIFSEWIRDNHTDRNVNNLSPYAPTKVAALRNTLGPSLHGFADVATTYFHDHTAPFYPEARAVAHELGVVLPLYSDGDEWGIERAAAMLTAQLHAAYTDDPAQTIDVPMKDLLPTDAWTSLAQIVAITGEIPEFIGSATPKSKPLAEKLATLDRLLVRKVVEDRVNDERQSLNGLLAEAPIETIRRLCVGVDERGFVSFGPNEQSSLRRLLGNKSFLNPLVDPLPEWFGKAEGFPPYETIDPLLLLAILNDLTGANEARDSQVAALFQVEIKNGELGDHIKILLESPLQSRKHAARILREMAAKTASRELRDRILIVDPSIGGKAAEPADSTVPAVN